MKHGSLFNGIGGFQLAAAWMGWENIFSCEIDDFCNNVTKKHFPDCIQHGDIKTTDFTIYRGRIDVLTGGFPCQPFSQAGKRKGTDDDRYLWPEMLRVIKEIRPTYVVGENVAGVASMAITKSEIKVESRINNRTEEEDYFASIYSLEEAMLLRNICKDFENIGYKIQPVVIPACAINAPHRRDRIWFIAYSESIGGREGVRTGSDPNKRQASEYIPKGDQVRNRNKTISGTGVSTNPNINGCNWSDSKYEINTNKGGQYAQHDTEPLSFTSYSQYERCKEQWGTGEFRSSPTVPSIRGRVEPGFRGGDDGFSSRVDRIKALGNAIVPQIAFELFKAIEKMEYEMQNL